VEVKLVFLQVLGSFEFFLVVNVVKLFFVVNHGEAKEVVVTVVYHKSQHAVPVLKPCLGFYLELIFFI
jgi:hypothetical protein